MSREIEFKKIKELMKEYYEYAKYGFFNTRNIERDKMFNLFNGKYFQLDLCYEYGYYEVFGATFEEFIELTNYYSKLRKLTGEENDKEVVSKALDNDIDLRIKIQELEEENKKLKEPSNYYQYASKLVKNNCDSLQKRIDKAIEYIDEVCLCSSGYCKYGDDLSPKHIVDILKGEE